MRSQFLTEGLNRWAEQWILGVSEAVVQLLSCMCIGLFWVRTTCTWLVMRVHEREREASPRLKILHS